jgi:2-polyprenyl-6-methoxyphenol hydroxylase-like FAD-dependent oxidoreductase
MKVLISGGGIAGLTFALCMSRAGHEVVVVDKAAGLRGGGYMIDFFASGFDAAERLGLLDDLAAIHYPIAKLVEVDEAGRAKAAVDYHALRRLLRDRHFNFQRGDLERTLHDRVASQVPIRYRTQVEAIDERADGVNVTLSDGSSDRWDLLVGADGIHSRVRSLLFGAEAQFTRFLGMRTAAYHLDAVPPALGFEDAFPMMTGVDRLAGFYPTRGGRLAVFLLYRVPRALAEAGGVAPCEELRQAFGQAGWILPEVLAACTDGPGLYFDDVTQIELPRWHTGRTVLIGDACQAVSLVAGQGASLAMAGAVVLSEALARDASPSSALASYQARVQPFVAIRQAKARKFIRWFLPDARWRLFARDLAMKAASMPFGNRLLLDGFDTESLFGQAGLP